MDGFSTLPNEIVAEIFLLCLPVTKYIRPHPSTAPILLTHVCSSWRAFASDLPDLWTSVDLADGKKVFIPSSELTSLNWKLLHQAELWNQQSRGHLTSIFLALAHHHCIPKEVATSFWHPLVHSVVNENLRSIRRLFIRFTWGDYGLPFYNLPSLEIPGLESLHFIVTKGSTPAQYRNSLAQLEGSAPYPTIFSRAPSLRRVIVDVPRTTYKKLHLPWPQLTHLILVSMSSLEVFYFIVQECPLLERLSMNIDNSPHVGGSALTFKTAVKMNNLRDLSLTHLFIYNPSFITTITFPVLEKFSFFCSAELAPPLFSWESLTPDHSRLLNQLGNLHTLVLGNHEMSSDILLEILRFTPQLIDLAVDVDLGTYCRFLRGLTYQSGPEEDHQNILKCLKTFRLYMEVTGDGRLQPHISDDFTLIFDAFLTMVLSRSASKSFLRSTDCEHATFSEETSVPARLRKVVLRVEDTGQLHQTTDEFYARSQTYPQLCPPHMMFDVICNVDEPMWLTEEIDTW